MCGRWALVIPPHTEYEVFWSPALVESVNSHTLDGLWALSSVPVSFPQTVRLKLRVTKFCRCPQVNLFSSPLSPLGSYFHIVFVFCISQTLFFLSFEQNFYCLQLKWYLVYFTREIEDCCHCYNSKI